MAFPYFYADGVNILNMGPSTVTADPDTVEIAGIPPDYWYFYGDVQWMNVDNSGTSYGADDVLVADDRLVCWLWGDAQVMNYAANQATVYGGNDTLIGGAGDNEIRGDASSMNLYSPGSIAYGGDDVLDGGGGDDMLIGDASTMNVESGIAQAYAGDDELTGGVGNDQLYGDAWIMNDRSGGAIAVGGDDTLDGGAGDDWLYGDAGTMNSRSDEATAQGGDDELTGGSGDDHLYGDAEFLNTYSNGAAAIGGHDTFVFGAGSGQDTIHDFRFGNDAEGRDLIDLSALAEELRPSKGPFPKPWQPPHVQAKHIEKFSDKAWTRLEDHITYEDGDAVIDLGAATGGPAGVDTITVIGVDELFVEDFLFV